MVSRTIGKNKFSIWIPMLIATVAIIIYLVFKNNNIDPNILFYINIYVIIRILIKSKFSIISLIMLLTNYILISAFAQYNYGNTYGVLALNIIPLHYKEIIITIFLFNVVMYIWIRFSNLLRNEKKLLKCNIKISRNAIYFCCVISIVAAIIAFPTIPFVWTGDNRFIALLPGNGWNHLSLCSLLIATTQIKRSKVVLPTLIFTVFWFLSHYERVDIIGFLMAFIIIILVKRDIKVTIKTIFKYGTLVFILLMLMVYLGEYRAGNTQLKLSELLRKVIIQNTACDLTYVYNSSIEFVENEELLYGKTYSTYINGMVPLVDTPYRAGGIIREKYNTPGGEFILTEPLINFGLLGVVIFTNLFCIILNIITKKVGFYRYILFIFLIITSFRYCWYGFSYIQTAIVYFIPFVVIGSIVLSRNKVIIYYEKK